MTKFLLRILPIACILFLSSCAAGYESIHPAQLNYPRIDSDNNFSYKYNVLKAARNRKFAKKEDKFNIRIAAIKIVNTTGHSLTYGQNYTINSGGSEIRILEPDVAAYALRQKVPTYLLYLLLTPTKLTVQEGMEPVKETRIGLIIGPGLAALNMIVASSANRRLTAELVEGSIINREIKNGETFYGLIAIRDNDFLPLSIKTHK